jgi:Ca2+-transporting ATPase
VIILVQSFRAQTKLTALQKLSAPKSNALREGKLVVLASENVVPGDVVFLKQGDLVPADCRVIAASSFTVNEAALTGESVEVEKAQSVPSGSKEESGLRRTNMVFLGTFVVSGTATAIVTQTGCHTRLGLMTTKLKRASVPEIFIRTRINKLAKTLALVSFLYIVASVGYGFFELYVEGDLDVPSRVAGDLAKSLTTSLSIMPINLPLLITTIMLTGALFMANEDIIIRNLNALECLGRVSVLCTDKTGTITMNRMTTKWIYIPLANGIEQLFHIKTSDKGPGGKIIPAAFSADMKKGLENPQEFDDKEPVKVVADTPLELALAGVFLNNDILIVKDEKRSIDPCGRKIDANISGDATDTAMLCLFERSNLDPEVYKERFLFVHSWPFDPKSRLITSVFKDRVTDRFALFTKGATETLLNKSDYVLDESLESHPFGVDYKKHVAERVELFSGFGERVISFAFKDMENFDPKVSRSVLESDLVYLGLVGIADPPRDTVYKTVCDLKAAGIKPVMITGDSLATARSIGKEVGIVGSGQTAVEGLQIGSLSDEEFLEASVFARISADDKMAIVSRYQKQNCVVAMTGDGVNDAQAISKADVGIAMGATGTDVARQSAHLVLAKDTFESIVKGIQEGRGVFEKIQNIVFFYIAVNLAEAVVYFGSSFVPNFYVLHAWQMVYIFGTAHFVPPLALIIDRFGSETMREKPRSTQSFISGHRKIYVLVFALSLALVLSAVYILAFNGTIPLFSFNKSGFIPDIPADAVSWGQAKARTLFLSVAIVAESALILSLRRLSEPIFKSLKDGMNRILWALVLAVPVVNIVLMYVPQIQNFLFALGLDIELIPLTFVDWLIVLGLGLLPVLLLEAIKAFYARKTTRTSKESNVFDDNKRKSEIIP